MDEKLFMAFLSKTLNLDEKQVAELVKTDDGKVKEDALANLLKANSTHIETLKSKDKPDTKEIFNNGYAKAKTEVLGNFESDLVKHYGLTSDKKGLDLIEEVIAEKTKALQAKEITADEVKKHEIYRTMVTNLTTEQETKVKEVEAKFTKEIEGYKKADTFKTIAQKADEVINKLNPVFSTNPSIAQNQRSTIHKALESKFFEIQKNGTIIPLNAEQKALENEHGHPVGFDTVVTEVTTSLFDLKKAEDRQSPGGGKDDEDGTDTTKWTGTAPKNDAEYMKMIASASSVEDKKAITEAYEKSQS